MYQTNEDDDEAWEIVNGRRVLRDMHRVRVRLADAQRSRERPRVTDSLGRPPGNRPGFLVSDHGRQAKAQAYADYENWTANRWRDQDDPNGAGSGGPRGFGNPPPGAYPLSAFAEGTSCTVDGSPGTLRRKGDWLVCIPNRQGFNGAANGDDEPDPDLDPEMAQSDRRSVADIQKAHAQNMARLIAERDAETQNAWRKR
jgi:hypothetical protein